MLAAVPGGLKVSVLTVTRVPAAVRTPGDIARKDPARRSLRSDLGIRRMVHITTQTMSGTGWIAAHLHSLHGLDRCTLHGLDRCFPACRNFHKPTGHYFEAI